MTTAGDWPVERQRVAGIDTGFSPETLPMLARPHGLRRHGAYGGLTEGRTLPMQLGEIATQAGVRLGGGVAALGFPTLLLGPIFCLPLVS